MFFLILNASDTTLGDYIETQDPFEDLYFFLQFLIKLNNALKVINQKNVIHRDIKPDNIFIKIENREYIPILADFGIARYYSDKKKILKFHMKTMIKDILDQWVLITSFLQKF